MTSSQQHMVPFTRINMGNINDIPEETIDVISHEHAPLIQNPVVSLGQHGTYFYDIKDLVRFIHTNSQNIFPHNRQRINWETDIDAVVWDNPHPSLPANYVTITRERIAAAKAYSRLWYIKSQPQFYDNGPRGVRMRSERYIEYRNQRSNHTFGEEMNAYLYNGHLGKYWAAHPYTTKDRELGIREPNAVFLRAWCPSPEFFDQSYRNFRHGEAMDIETYFLDAEMEEEEEDERAINESVRVEICRYWDAHPADPQFDSAHVINIVRDSAYHGILAIIPNMSL